MLAVISVILATLVLLIVVDYYYKKSSERLLSKCKIPGPKTLPLFGNALSYLRVNNENIFSIAQKNREKYGRIYRLWLFHQLSINITDPKHLEFILTRTEEFYKSGAYDFLKKWLGTGLLLSNGKKWFRRRKIITPTFHFKILEQFVVIFDRHSRVLVQKLQEYADGETSFDIYPHICLATLDVIAETAMGVKVQAQQNPKLKYVQALAFVSKVMADCLIKSTRCTEWLFFLTAPRTYWKMLKGIKVMHNFTNNVIKERRAALERSMTDGSSKAEVDETTLQPKQRLALLDVLLQSTIDGTPLSNEDIREEVETFMFEGHDTTTTAISFCLYLLARHPAVQSKLFTEIRQILGDDKDAPITYQKLQELKYLECCIKESLRLYPSVPFIDRITKTDVVLDDDVIIPAGTRLTLSFYFTSRDAEYFPEPNTFKPERFESKIAAGRGFAYTPFSAGARNCIGQKFAVLEMKCVISKILQYFELLPLGLELRPTYNLVLRSASGVNLGLRERQNISQ